MKKLIFTMTLMCISVLAIQTTAQTRICSEELGDFMLEASLINSSILWEKAVSSAQINFEDTGENSDLLNLCYAYYGAVGNCLSTRNSDAGESYIENALIACNQLAQIDEYKSLAYSLQGGFKGLAIAFSPMKGMMLGPESDRLIEKSLKLNEKNPFAWLQKGSSQYNTPRLFGGSVSASIESFKKSVEYFDLEASNHLWLKLEAMTWLGQAYYQTEAYTEAKKVYDQVLEIAPGYQWVETILLPKTEQKIK